MEKSFTFISHALGGESGYISPKLEVSLYDDHYTRSEMLEELQAFMIGCGYQFEAGEHLAITNGEKK